MGTLSDWLKTLTWKCDICHEERPDQFISVYPVDESTKHQLPPGTWKHNWKYCNDREACAQSVKAKGERSP